MRLEGSRADGRLRIQAAIWDLEIGFVGLALLVVVVTLVGFVMESVPLRSWLASSPPMQLPQGVGCGLLSVAALMWGLGGVRLRRWVPFLALPVVVLSAAAIGAEPFSSFNRAFFDPPPVMGLLLGTATMLLPWADTLSRRGTAMGVLAAVGGVLTLLGLIGYASGTTSLYSLSHEPPWAFPDVLCGFLLSVALLLFGSARGRLGVLSAHGPGGRLARWLLPAAILTPIGGQAISTIGQSLGVFAHSFGDWLVTALISTVLSVLVLRVAEALQRLDEKRWTTAKALHISEERYRDLFEQASDAIVIADGSGRIEEANVALERMLGFSRAELVGMNAFELVAPEDREYAQQAAATRFAGGAEEVVEIRLLAKDGTLVFAEATGRFLVEDGQPMRLEAIVRDKTEAHELRQQLIHQAFHDPLTALPNRSLFVDRLDQALARARRSRAVVTVLLLDLDNFKLVNDSLGHDAGDALLGALAPLLQSAVRPSDTVARLGGDEFVFLIEASDSRHRIVPIAERILATIAKPIPTSYGEQRISGSLGIAIAGEDTNSGELLRNADTAMYRAKERNRGSYEVFDAPMRARVVRERDLQTALAAAMSANALSLYYQPIVSPSDGRILGVEALIRWQHDQWGWVQPSEFIPVAETSGLIVPLSQHTITQAAEQAALWRHLHPQALPWGIAINLSPIELSNTDFVQTFERTLATHGARPDDFMIEITERTFIDADNSTLYRNLKTLHELGVQLSLDDFGTGYSALASLQSLPFAIVKIDRQFIRAICEDEPLTPITQAVTTLAHALDLHVVAEGVETPLQADTIRDLSCDAAQGYHYARPQPASNLSQLLQADRNNSCPHPQNRGTPKTPASQLVLNDA